jgi:hypothetical protein
MAFQKLDHGDIGMILMCVLGWGRHLSSGWLSGQKTPWSSRLGISTSCKRCVSITATSVIKTYNDHWTKVPMSQASHLLDSAGVKVKTFPATRHIHGFQATWHTFCILFCSALTIGQEFCKETKVLEEPRFLSFNPPEESYCRSA